MKAIVCNQYGSPDVLQLRNLPKPTPKPDEVLVKVRATTVAAGDIRMRLATREALPFWPLSKLAIGISKPSQPVFGIELAGDVEAVGAAVTRFKVGDAIFAAPGMKAGGYAEYACIKETAALALKPNNLNYQEAAALAVGAGTAYYFLQKANLKPGMRVLIYGASGSVGTYAVQLARLAGAEVTGVCSTANLEMVQSLGAHHVIDYKREDFTRQGRTYDLIVDTVGKTTFGQCKRALTPKGIFMPIVMNYREAFQMLTTSIGGGKRVVSGAAPDIAEVLKQMGQMAERGDLRVVIDRCYPLEQIVEAHRYVETGRKKGNVTIAVA
jgi:NADPH:quinone reductase-like Zn-dependent oxidoreductase